MRFINTKNIIPDNGIIVYNDTPCLVLSYFEDDIQTVYANVIYKNTQVVLEYYEEWIILHYFSWKKIIIREIEKQNYTTNYMYQNIRICDYEINNLNDLLKDKTLKETQYKRINQRILELKEMINHSKKCIKECKNKIEDLKNK